MLSGLLCDPIFRTTTLTQGAHDAARC